MQFRITTKKNQKQRGEVLRKEKQENVSIYLTYFDSELMLALLLIFKLFVVPALKSYADSRDSHSHDSELHIRYQNFVFANVLKQVR